MEWWEWVTWSVTAAIAAGGLVLGIRAERRNRYQRVWLVTDGYPTRFVNRTGEDATRVKIEIFGGHIRWGKNAFDHLAADEKVEMSIEPETPDGMVGYRISWTRPANGKAYVLRSKGVPKRSV